MTKEQKKIIARLEQLEDDLRKMRDEVKLLNLSLFTEWEKEKCGKDCSCGCKK